MYIEDIYSFSETKRKLFWNIKKIFNDHFCDQ